MPRIIITGGPGAGKTSLLAALQQRGYPCSEEISRQLIMEESAKGSGCLPWIDLAAFADRALERMIASYQAEQEAGPCFFDRGIPDIIAYLRVAGLPVSEKFEQAITRYPYAATVFLLPPWDHIYVQDDARWQTFEEAETIYHQIGTIYRSSSYHIEELPKCPVEERTDLILKMLQL